MNRFSTKTNYSEGSNDSNGSASSQHGSQAGPSRLEQTLQSISSAWSTFNRRANSHPNDMDLVHGGGSFMLEGGAVNALFIFHHDGTCHGWRQKQPTWPLPPQRDHVPFRVRHAVTI